MRRWGRRKTPPVPPPAWTPSPRQTKVKYPPADGRYLASAPMLIAISEQTTKAISTASGRAPPAYGTAAPRLNATAEAGAIVVIDWNKTPGRPMALRRSVVCSDEVDVDSVATQLLLLYPQKVEIAGRMEISARAQNNEEECAR